jgi:signal peptidase I
VLTNEQIPQAEISFSKHMRSWLRDLVISIAASVLIITCIYQPVRVEGTSMQPRLHNDDRLFINKFIYKFEKIHRGDVVVFHYPGDPSKSYIKRVIALPGDDLRITDGTVFLNGSRLAEPYVPERFEDGRSVAEEVIPNGDFWVMGDHRSVSSDSRDFGPVPRGMIYGKASFVYWPTNGVGLVH